MRRTLLVTLVIAGCSEEKAAQPAPPAPVVVAPGPVSVRFGSCAHAGFRFVSGPRPRPLLVTDAPPTPRPPSPVLMMNVAVPMPSHSVGRPHPIRTAGYVGFIDDKVAPTSSGRGEARTGEAQGSDDIAVSDLLGSGESMGLGMRGTGQANTGPTYGGGMGNTPLGGFGHGHGGVRAVVEGPVTFGTPTVKPPDALDGAIVRRYIKRTIQSISLCYERMQQQNEKLAGALTATFAIGKDGLVSMSEAKGLDPEVAKCIALTIKSIQFPKPKEGSIAMVEYPFTFKPAADAHMRLAAYQTSVNAENERARTGLYARDPRDRGGAGVDTSPLSTEASAIEACLRAGKQRAGALVLELTFDANKQLTKSAVHGTDDEMLRTCLGKAVAAVHGDEGAQRCPLAFGELPVAQMPALDITAHGVVMNGTTLADTASIDATKELVVPAIATAVTERVAATIASTAVVTMHGPLVVKPEPTTPMRVVKRVAASITAGGDDFVFAVKAGDGWTLVTLPPSSKRFGPLVVPVVPMPIGTGAVWNPLRVHGYSSTEPVTLRVTKDHVHVAVRVDKPAEALAMSDVIVKLGALLKTENNAEVVIIAADDVPYELFYGVVDVVQDAGFDWQLAAR